MSNQLTKADAKRRRKEGNPNNLFYALRTGGPIVWLSCIIMGLGNIVAGQFIKGFMFLAIEAAIIYLIVMPLGCIDRLARVPGLGTVLKKETWNDYLGVYEYDMYEESWKILLYGVIAIAIFIALIFFWQVSVRSGNVALTKKRNKKHVNTFWEDIKALFDENIHKLLMTFPFVCLLVFTVIPLVYMICMAFTNYNMEHSPMFDWVGLNVFKRFFSSSDTIRKEFWSVLGWTMVWAFFATFLNFFLGTFVAMIINRPSTKAKGLWRTMFSFTIAVPQFISLLVINKMFMTDGIVNNLLIENGFITEKIRFLDDPSGLTPRIFVIVINLWVGIPFTIMQVTGILKNIPGDLYEAARIDGANATQQFMNITLPYMIFVMTPYIITSFTGNINNFNVIYLLTGGGPKTMQNTAGKTDLLVTWLYKMSTEDKEYNVAAIIGIFTFIVLAVISLVTYRSSGSYKDEEGFK